MNRLWIFFVGLVILGLNACGGSRSTDVTDAESMSTDGMAVVSAIDLVGENGTSSVNIRSDQELKYNVFKLTDPDRVMVDLIDAKLANGIPSEIPGNDLVSQIRVQAIEDSLSNLVRIEIELSKSGNYLASLDGTSLSVRVLPAGMSASEMAANEPAPMDDPLALPPIVEPTSEPSLPAPMVEPMAETPSESMTALSEIPASEPPAMMPPPESSPLEMADSAPAPAPAPMPEIPVVTAPVVEAPIPAPVLEDLPAEAPPAFAAPLPVEEKKETSKRVEVVPEGENIPSIATQEIPTTMFTEGTSTLTGMSSRVYTGNRVSLEFQDAPIQDVIRLIADVSKLNIIVADDVKGTLTLKLVDVPWDQALDIILTSKGLDKVQHGNILRVAPVEALKKEREIALANDKAAKQLEPTKIKIFNVNYATSDEMASRLKNVLSERGKVDTDERTNTIIVEDIAEHLSKAENLIKVLDTQTPQVRIESRIVQANDRFVRSIGIQWGPSLRLDSDNGKETNWQFPRTINVGSAGFEQPEPSALGNFAVDALPGNQVTGGALGLRLGSVSDIFNLDLQLQYAENEQLGRIVSRPSITVLDKKQASIIQGSRIPFLSSSSEGSNVQFQEAGVEISVTPQITNDGAVILQVAARSNEPASENVGGNPIINIREATTEMLVKSGRTAVLGGVFRTSDTRGEGGVPGLMHIPVLGWLFKGRSRSSNREETLIFITPYILTDNREGALSPDSTSKLAP